MLRSVATNLDPLPKLEVYVVDGGSILRRELAFRRRYPSELPCTGQLPSEPGLSTSVVGTDDDHHLRQIHDRPVALSDPVLSAYQTAIAQYLLLGHYR